MRKSQIHSLVSGRRARRSLAGVVAAILAAAAVIGGSVALAPPAAAGILPSATTITPSTPFATTGSTVAVTSTVKVLNLPGLLVVPTGKVTFSSPGATSTSANLGICLLTICTARGSITLPVAGPRTVTATYAGDLLAAASSKSTTVTVYNPLSSDSETCPASQIFCTASTSTGDCAADTPVTCVGLDVTDVDSSTDRTVNAALVTGNEPSCPDAPAIPGTPWALFSSTSADSQKFVHMEFHGPQATALAPLDMSNQLSYQWYGCYTTDQPFNGVVGGGTDHNSGSLVAAPQSGGLYQAKLPRCIGEPYLNPDSDTIDGLDPSSPVPCVNLNYEDNFFGIRLDISIVTQPGDPKYIPS